MDKTMNVWLRMRFASCHQTGSEVCLTRASENVSSGISRAQAIKSAAV